MHSFRVFNLQEADHYPHLETIFPPWTDSCHSLGLAQEQLAKNNAIIVPAQIDTVFKHTLVEQRAFYKWTIGIHVRLKKLMHIEGREQVFHQQAKEIINQVGWSADAVHDITLTWALYYGRYLYEYKNGMAPIYGDKFIQAALEVESLDDVLNNKEL